MSHLSTKEHYAISVLLVILVNMISIDSIGDIRSGGGWGHAIMEVTVAIGLFGILIWLWIAKAKEVTSIRQLARERESALKHEADEWRARVQSIKPNLTDAIDSQFASWNLTNAERETARLVLKGLSNKEIASVRSASELTIKQQTNAIYKKSGLSSRAQLIAFFLEDLF